MAIPAIKTPGGVMVRVIEALNGFRSKFGYWPSSLEMEAEAIAHVATELLTPFGFFLLQSRVQIINAHEQKVVAKGHPGDEFDYGEEGWRSDGKHEHDARAWLGLIEEYEPEDEVIEDD